MNADGKIDVVSVTYDVGASTWVYGTYNGNGDGTFANGLLSSSIGSFAPWLIRTADFNNDGLPDIITGAYDALRVSFNQHSEPDWMGGGPGQFWGVWQSGSLAANPRDIDGVDIDGDGVKDVVVVLEGGSVDVYRGVMGSYFYEHGFWPATSYPVGNLPERMVSGDFDGDGKVDIVVVNSGSNTVSTLLNSGCVP
jgi:hypothetical protein